MRVRDIMTRDVESVERGCSLREAAARMRRRGVGMLPIVEERRVVGVLTDRDIVVRAVAEGADVAALTAGDVMSAGPVFCYDEARLDAAARIMAENRIRRLPVTDRDENLVGVLSLDDFPKRSASRQAAAEVLAAVAGRR